MKKSLIITLALVFVLGIAGTAFAANPFTDVPANHWAYSSISKLAQAGIIDGYGDGRFVGNNTMTRFEMAQIVAKAMAKVDSADGAQRAQIEKLAAEFADELDSLGVRVARLEKNADNVKITGEARFAYYSYDRNLSKELSNGTGNDYKNHDSFELRSRIWLSGQVNDRWKYVGMFEAKENLRDNDRNGTVKLRRAWVEGSIGAVEVTAGTYNPAIMYGTLFDADVDGLTLGYKTGKFAVDVFTFRPDKDNVWLYGDGDFFGFANDLNARYAVYGTNMSYAFTDRFNAQFAYYKVDGVGHNNFSDFDANIFELGVDYKFNDKFMMWAEYIRGDEPSSTARSYSYNDTSFSKSGWAVGMQYGEAQRDKVGSWQLTAAYYDVPVMAAIAPTTELNISSFGDGFKGWTIGGSYMMAKNIDLNVEYFSFKNQKEVYPVQKTEKLLWTYVRFYF